MDLGLNERVAIVCGAGGDVGRSVALSLAAEGVKLAVCDYHEDELRGAEMDFARVATQRNILALPADLSENRSIRRVVRDTFNRFGQVDILALQPHCIPPGPPRDDSEDERGDELERSFRSALRLSREVIPYMKQEHWGRIINLMPIHAPQTDANPPLSLAQQQYLIGYFKTLADELAPFNITVNTLLAGPLDTRELRRQLQEQAAAANTDPAALVKQTHRSVPMSRLGKPEEVGDLAAFLASERAAYLTGGVISLDGGLLQKLRP